MSMQLDYSPSKNILVLTGAGISAESGIQTFRDQEGLWHGYRPEDVASPIAFREHPELVHQFYNERRTKLLSDSVQPNAAHLALAEFERNHPGKFTLVTQNVDNLHQRSGSQNILPMHGELLKARCQDTGQTFDWREPLTLDTPHPLAPERRGRLRSHVVWFGELPLRLPEIQQAAEEADIFIAIGTSGVVYPAAAIIDWTPATCRSIEINLEATPRSSRFEFSLRGKAAVEVPRFLKELTHAT